MAHTVASKMTQAPPITVFHARHLSGGGMADEEKWKKPTEPFVMRHSFSQKCPEALGGEGPHLGSALAQELIQLVTTG